ncbi:Grap2 and cyclin-D-interacting-domain-containing protein [Coemansia spiralis]|nr:Grap2 and cyclin-D-interacting-domain-containing protein [Coemansia spiralis]
MAESDIKKETQKVLHSTASNIVVLLEHIRPYEGSDQPIQDFSGPKFKEEINELATAIDKEVTRFIIACKPPALDKEICELCPKINAGLFHLVQKVNQVPKKAGKTYLDAVRKAVCRSLISAIGLINSFIKEKVEVDKSALYEVSYTSASGIFWEHCKALAQIPADNRSAVVLAWKNSVGNLVKDAVEELQQTLEEYQTDANDEKAKQEEEAFSDDSMDDDFNPEIPPGRLEEARKIQRLVTVAKHTCDKVGLRCIRDCRQLDEERIIWLDRLVDLGKPVQDSVDDLVATLFINDDSWKRQAEMESSKLTKALLDLITLAITFVDDSHLQWFELCRKQLDATQLSTKVVR